MREYVCSLVGGTLSHGEFRAAADMLHEKGIVMAVDQSLAESKSVAEEKSTLLFSADSHVIENSTLWDGVLSEDYFPPNQNSFNESTARPGRVDPVARIDEMAIDGVDGEILYPTLALGFFGLDQAKLQQQVFQVYNSWMIEFCKVSPKKLYGLGLISVYEIDQAIKELERCANEGLIGCEIWQTPHPDLPFTSSHYEPFWQAAASLNMPISLHILTGFNYSKAGIDRTGGFPNPIDRSIQQYKGSVTLKLQAVADSLMEIMFSGVLDRNPNMNLVLVENEVGWIPFLLDQYDYYTNRFAKERPTAMTKRPSEYFGSQVFSTFFRDPIGTKMLDWWGSDGCMWSSDYPHPNSTWPNSRQVVSDNLGYLDATTFNKVVRGNAHRLYHLSETR